MARKGRYEDHPHVILGPKSDVRTERMTPDEFRARYYEIDPITAPPGSVVIVTFWEGGMRVLVDLPDYPLPGNGLHNIMRD